MKNLTMFILAVSSILIVASTVSADCDDVHMGSHRDMNGVRTIFCSTKDDVLKTPQWNGYSDNLPLKISRATKIGIEWLKKNNPKFDDFTLVEFSIQRVGNSELMDRWYYKLDYQAKIGDRILYGSPFFVTILLDGTVVEPIIKKE